MSLIKDIYSLEFYNRFSDSVSQAIPGFNAINFKDLILVEDFTRMEWKERMKHTTRVLHAFMPENFSDAVKQIEKIIAGLRKDNHADGNLAFMFFPDYIETYGIDHFEVSVKALELITPFISCEFAVRPFILKYNQRMMDMMTGLSLHEDYRVRRLASEGSRPRLPWAMAIPFLKKDPSSILPILENLKNDPSEWVRRSVANNLNDIAKDHPDVILGIASRWKGVSAATDAIIKHGSRTLLKQGHTEILKFYGLSNEQIAVSGFKISTPVIRLGDSVQFSFDVNNGSDMHKTVRLEYGVYYLRSKDRMSKKVFKISERTYPPGETALIQRKQSFRPITTRRYYTGKHRLSIIVNGEEKDILSFEVKN
jgi:3-methyladenine DNA glycosylase AlkC